MGFLEATHAHLGHFTPFSQSELWHALTSLSISSHETEDLARLSHLGYVCATLWENH